MKIRFASACLGFLAMVAGCGEAEPAARPIESGANAPPYGQTFSLDAVSTSYSKRDGTINSSIRFEHDGEPGKGRLSCRREDATTICRMEFFFDGGTIAARGRVGTGSGPIEIYETTGAFAGLGGVLRGVKSGPGITRYTFSLE